MPKKTNFRCDQKLDDLKVSKESISLIFDDNKLVRDDTYQNAITEILSEKYKCAFNLKNTNKGKGFISFYVYCTVNRKKVYCLKCFKSDIKKGEDLNLEVRTNTTTQCSHVEKDIRNLSKDKRQEAKNALKDSTVTKVSFFKYLITINH